MNDLKYLFAYTVPVAAYIAFESTGIGCYAAVFYAFIVLPVLDVVTGETQTNISKEAVLSKKNKRVFDWMLYLNLPIVFGLLFLVFTKIQAKEYALYELIGMGLSAGILLATNAINVAHELGHRKPYFERFMSKLLYMPCLYMHFYIEHNFGHHLHVGTPEDGATAKYNQNVYSFWWSSVTKQYFGAWKRQLDLLKAQKKSFLSLKNDVFWYHFIQAGYLFSVYFLFSPKVLVFAVAVGILSFLFLVIVLGSGFYIDAEKRDRKFKPKAKVPEFTKIESPWIDSILSSNLQFGITGLLNLAFSTLIKKTSLFSYVSLSIPCAVKAAAVCPKASTIKTPGITG